jgi:c-di-GMP-binding flagellar brake protein YcgR
MAAATTTPQRRKAPRAEVRLPVTFARAKGHGQPVTARTIDVSTGGARVAADRPLRVDERLHFDLLCEGDRHVCGECRVLREHTGQTYAVRFERFAPGDEAARELERLTAS